MQIVFRSISKLRFSQFLILGALLLSTGCAMLKPAGTMERTASTYRSSDLRQEVVETARSYLGAPYRYGGTGSRGFDCSGLVFTVFASHGISLPRQAEDQARFGRIRSQDQAQRGDLAVFSLKGKVNHVGIITRASRKELWVVHSTTSRGVIHEDVLQSTYWSRRLKGIRDALGR